MPISLTTRYQISKPIGSVKDYFFPVLWCLLWFVYDPYFTPGFAGEVIYIMLFLLAMGSSTIFFKQRRTDISFLFGIIVFGFVLSLQTEPLTKALFWQFLNGYQLSNLAKIMLLFFFVNNYQKAVRLMQVFLVFSFVTVICIGLYQFFTNDAVIQSYELLRFGGDGLTQNRLFGLIYIAPSDAGTAILVFLAFLLSQFIHKRKGIIFYFLFLIILAALFFTFTRAAWIAGLFMIIITAISVQKFKLKSLVLLSLIFILFIYIVFFVFSTYFIDQSERLYSAPTTRLERYSVFWNYGIWNLFIGFGIFADVSKSFEIISNGLIGTSIHNHFLQYVLTFGFPVAVIIYIYIIRQLIMLRHLFLASADKNSNQVLLFLFLAQIAVIVNESFASNMYYYSFFLYQISYTILKDLSVENQISFRKVQAELAI
jgi:hypothetical protein